MNKALFLAILQNDSKKVAELLDSIKTQDPKDRKTQSDCIDAPLCPSYQIHKEILAVIQKFLDPSHSECKDTQSLYFNNFVKLLLRFIPEESREPSLERDKFIQSKTCITPLMLAAFLGHEAIIKLLIHHSNLTLQNYLGMTAFFCAYLHASATGNVKPLQIFLDNGADINQVFYEEIFHTRYRSRCGNASRSAPPVDTDYGTLLTCAVFENNAGLVQFLVAAGADVNAASILGVTPLSLCLEMNIKESKPTGDVARLLLEKGAIIDKQTRWEYEKAGEAAREYVEGVRRTWPNSRNKNDFYVIPVKEWLDKIPGFSSSVQPSDRGDSKSVAEGHQLWEQNLSQDEQDSHMDPVITLFCSSYHILYFSKQGLIEDHIPEFQELFEHERLSFILRSADRGKTALHLACEHGQLNAVIALLRALRNRSTEERREVLTARDQDQKTAMALAECAKQDREKIIALLESELKALREDARSLQSKTSEKLPDLNDYLKMKNILLSWTGGQPFAVDPNLENLDLEESNPKTDLRYFKFKS